MVLTAEQTSALNALRFWAKGKDPFFAISGAAGTGKSTLMAKVTEILAYMSGQRHFEYDEEGQIEVVALCATTGKAALRLQQATGIPTTTLHKILYEMPTERGGRLGFSELRKPPARFVVVDEASMISAALWKDLSKWPDRGCRVVLVGDPFQLPPVEKEDDGPRAAFSVFREVEGPTLTEVVRSEDGVTRAATEIRTQRRAPRGKWEGYEFIRISDEGREGKAVRGSRSPVARAVARYLDDPTDHMLVTWTNASRMAANELVRIGLGKKGNLPLEGEPVLVRKTDRKMGVLNGEIIVCKETKPGPAIPRGKNWTVDTIWITTREGSNVLAYAPSIEEGLTGKQPIIQDWQTFYNYLDQNELPRPVPVTWGYCGTCHVFQGSEAAKATVFLGENDGSNPRFREPTFLPNGERVPFSIRFLYTAVTRAKKSATVVVK